MSTFKKPKMIRINASKAKNYIEPIMQYITYKNGDFKISKYQVTFDEYDIYCDEMKKEKPDDRNWGRGRRPVINVSWHNVVAYCEWLTEKTGANYRLPTNEEWDYACTKGTTTKWSFGDDEKELGDYAWYTKNSKRKTHPVGLKKKNPWELYDMHGNVWEWCEDWYDKDKDRKVLRGGSWFDGSNISRSSIRSRSYPTDGSNYVGFRLLRTLP